MGFLDKAKAAAGQAAAKAKQSAEDIQLKVDLGSAYDDLGKAAFELIESGEIVNEKLDAPAAKVRELRLKIEGEEKAEPTEADATTPAADAEPAPSELPADAPDPAPPGEPAPPADTDPDTPSSR